MPPEAQADILGNLQAGASSPALDAAVAVLAQANPGLLGELIAGLSSTGQTGFNQPQEGNTNPEYKADNDNFFVNATVTYQGVQFSTPMIDLALLAAVSKQFKDNNSKAVAATLALHATAQLINKSLVSKEPDHPKLLKAKQQNKLQQSDALRFYVNALGDAVKNHPDISAAMQRKDIVKAQRLLRKHDVAKDMANNFVKQSANKYPQIYPNLDEKQIENAMRDALKDEGAARRDLDIVARRNEDQGYRGSLNPRIGRPTESRFQDEPVVPRGDPPVNTGRVPVAAVGKPAPMAIPRPNGSMRG